MLCTTKLIWSSTGGSSTFRLLALVGSLHRRTHIARYGVRRQAGLDRWDAEGHPVAMIASSSGPHTGDPVRDLLLGLGGGGELEAIYRTVGTRLCNVRRSVILDCRESNLGPSR